MNVKLLSTSNLDPPPPPPYYFFSTRSRCSFVTHRFDLSVNGSMMKKDEENHQMTLQSHYGKFVRGGGDGLGVLDDRAKQLGYTKEKLLKLLQPTKNNDADAQPPNGTIVELLLDDASLFQVSCGSGCPLLLLQQQQQKLARPNDSTANTTDPKLIMDLGCGAGHDVLLMAAAASSLGGKNGNVKVIGVDLTPEMIESAKENAKKYPILEAMTEFILADFCSDDDEHAEFLSKYEHQVDLIISNGVFNLCGDQKSKAFEVAFRLLRPGGRLVFSDVMKLTDPNLMDPNAKIATSIGDGDVFSS